MADLRLVHRSARGERRHARPIPDQISAKRAGAVKVVKMDFDANPMTPGKFGITSIPTLMMFRGGQLVQRHVGSLNKAALDQFVGKGIA